MKFKSPFGNDKKTQILIFIFVVILIAAFASKARSHELEVKPPVMQIEAGATTIRGPTSTIGMTVVYPDRGPRDADYQFGLRLVGEAEGNRNQMAAVAQMVDGFGKFDLGLGVAFLQHEDAYNGSRFNFALSAQYRLTEHLLLLWEHWSCAGTCEPNAGRDMVRVAYRFSP